MTHSGVTLKFMDKFEGRDSGMGEKPVITSVCLPFPAHITFPTAGYVLELIYKVLV